MANTYVQNYVHLVFHVKSKTTLLLKDDTERIFQYIGGIVKQLGSTLIEIGGMPDHVHVLTSLPKTIALADFMRTIKSESSKWIKTLNPYYSGFAWQEGYGAFSISASVLQNVAKYIRNQSEHHKKLTFLDEYKLFLKAYGIEYNERFLPQ